MTDNSRHFDGTSANNIVKTDPTGINVNAAWTFGCWVYINSYGSDGRVIAKVGDPGNRSRGVNLIVTSGGLLALISPSGTVGSTVVGTGAWKKVGGTKAAAGIGFLSVYLNGVLDGTANQDPPNALQAGDTFQTSDDDGVRNNLNGRVAWLFWLQGVILADGGASYLDDPQQLIDDYGPSGTILANALKVFWSMQCESLTEDDLSDTGNEGSYGTISFTDGDGPSPSTPWDPCAAPPTPPTPGFSTAITLDAVTVTSTAVAGSNPITSIEYDYGDLTGRTALATHNYAVKGTYTITQYVNDGVTAEQSTNHSVTTQSRHIVEIRTVGGRGVSGTIDLNDR